MARNRIQENGLGVSSYLGLQFRSYLGLPFRSYLGHIQVSHLGHIQVSQKQGNVHNFHSILYSISFTIHVTVLFQILFCFVQTNDHMITCQGGTSPQGRKITLEQALCWTPTLWPPRPPRCIIKKIKCDSTVYHPIQ